MKKILIIILFLFLLCGCGVKEDLLIGVSRVNESVVCEEYCSLDLKIISSQDLESVYLEKIDADATYDYEIKESVKELKVEEDTRKIYSYDLSIQVFNPTQIKTIDLKIEDEIYTFDIGSFECLERRDNITSHLECSVVKNGNLIEGATHHKINISNKSDRPIIISTVSLLNKTPLDIKVCKNIRNDLILSDTVESMADCYIDSDEGMYRVNYLLEVGYIYKGRVYETYFEITDSSVVESVTNFGNEIVVDIKCFDIIE